MRFMDLPVETILQILVHMTCAETHDIISKLSQGFPECRRSSILELLYQRLYQDKLILTVNDTVIDNTHNTVTIDEFERKMSSGSYESFMFQNISPKSFEIDLVRPPNDYSHFIKRLYKLNEMLESKDANVVPYMAAVRHVIFSVNGNSVMVDNPTSLSVIVLKVLSSLCVGDLTAKISKISIVSTDIGDIYPQKWLQVFDNFPSLSYLDLSNNLISSSMQEYPDLLASCLKSPRHLKELHLDSNFISQIPSTLVLALPRDLEVLSLTRNTLTSIGVEPQDQFTFARDLPKLRLLKLNHNHNLTLINPGIFAGMERKGFRMEIESCNVIPAIVNDMTSIFADRGYSLIH